jgi:hypothetical protein
MKTGRLRAGSQQDANQVFQALSGRYGFTCGGSPGLCSRTLEMHIGATTVLYRTTSVDKITVNQCLCKNTLMVANFTNVVPATELSVNFAAPVNGAQASTMMEELPTWRCKLSHYNIFY